jgi:phosphoglucomutase
VKILPTTPFSDQRPGTSGLRKKTREFMQPRYVENFIQSIFDVLREDRELSGKTLIVGGDGRFYNRAAIRIILPIAAANGFGRIMVGRGGILSTPAMSAVIRRQSALGGLILSASHNPGGIDADFGIKYNAENGGPAPEALTERFFHRTLKIDRYLWTDVPEIDIDREGAYKIEGTDVLVIDPLADYTALMQELFDFEALRTLFRSGFRMLFDGMHGATGLYARNIFERCLGAAEGTVLNGDPLEDFGGHHPDPNLVYEADFVKRLSGADAPDFGAACDADGDRNMILGRSFFVGPGDSLALITEHAPGCIPGYRGGLAGVARSLPTSTAVDRVAAAAGIKCYETPTGWKYFGNLMDAGLCTLCGEESFGTGSSHLREKDGIWAVLCWLSLLASTKRPLPEVVQAHWRKFGRSYFERHDYEALDTVEAGKMMDELQSHLPPNADDFSYTDPVDKSETPNAGIRFRFPDGSRIVCRLSGTGTEGATLRLYLERYSKDQLDGDVEVMLKPLAEKAEDFLGLRKRFGREKPTLIT